MKLQVRLSAALAALFTMMCLAGCNGALQASGGGSSGGGGGSNPAPTVAFSASATSIAAGQSTTLQWQTTNATSVSISPGPGTVALSGSQAVQPTQTTTYTLTASGAGGQTTQSVTITVVQSGAAPTVTLTANPTSIAPGQLSTITWSTTNAASITISPQIVPTEQLPLGLSGSATVSPTSTTTYAATATGPGGTATASVQVAVTNMQVNLSVNPSTVSPGQSATLSWTTIGVQKLVIDNGVGDVSGQLPNGSVTVTPGSSTTYTATATGPSGTVTQSVAITVGTPPPSSSPVKHIIFILQENRSFDSYFGQLGPYRANRLQQMGISASASDVDGTPSNVTLTNAHTGTQTSPYHYATECTENLTPAWNESHHDVSLKGGDGAWASTTSFDSSSFHMKGFLDTTGSVTEQYDPNGTRAMGYYDQTDLPYYYELATQFATSDRWYSPLLANTIPNRMYMFSGTSLGHVRPDENLKPAGGWPQPTIFSALNKAKVSWRYYYQDSSVFLSDFADWSDPAVQGKVYNLKDWFNVLSQSDADKLLPQVVFIERGGQIGLDEHPLNNIQKGAADVQNIVSALMNSPAWATSVFIYTFDEAGGLYDHVPPFQVPLPDNVAPILKSGDIQGTFNVSGMRLPLIVISPYVKPHFVSHTNRDLTSILRFIERTFNVPSLTARDAAADDMSEFFDFSNPALLNAPGGQPWATFLPQQPTNGVCNQQLEAAP